MKAVRAALEAKDYQDAATKAKELIKSDPKNYHAYDDFCPCKENMTNRLCFHRHVFLGLAYDRLKIIEEAESAYSAATDINAEDKTAWQGLVSLYEKQGGCEHDGYRQAVIALGKIFANKYVRVPVFIALYAGRDADYD